MSLVDRCNNTWSHFQGILTSNIGNHLYHYLIIAYVAGGVTSAILSVILGYNRHHIGIAFILGALLPLFLMRKLQLTAPDHASASLPYFKLTLIAFTILFLLGIGVNYTHVGYTVSEYYFIIVAVQSGLILLQIIAPGDRTRVETTIIIVEIFTISATLYIVFGFLFPGLYGNDSSFHAGFIDSILSTGYINEYNNAAQYLIFPSYEIILAELVALGSINIKGALVAFSITQIGLMLLIYPLCKKLFNSRVGLLALLILSLSTHALASKYSFYPGGTATIFFILFLYLVICMDKKPYFEFLLTVLLIASIFFHPMLPFFELTALVIIYVVSRFYRGIASKFYFGLITLFSLVVLLQWNRPLPNGQGDLFTWFVWLIYVSLFREKSVTQATLSPLYNWGDIMLYELGFTILIALSIAGAIFVLNHKWLATHNEQKDKIVTLSIILLLIVPLPYLLAIVFPNSLPNRWFPFIEILASIFASVTLLYLIANYRGAIRVFTILLLPVLIFFCITSPISNPNADVYSHTLSLRASTTTSELSCIEFIHSESDIDNLCGNSAFMHFISKTIANKDHYIKSTESISADKKFVIRNYDLEMGFIIPTFGGNGLLFQVVPADDAFVSSMDRLRKIYENGETRIYSSE